jgi:hypothetical protein
VTEYRSVLERAGSNAPQLDLQLERMGLVHDGACLLRLIGDGSDGPLEDGAVSLRHAISLRRWSVMPPPRWFEMERHSTRELRRPGGGQRAVILFTTR